VTEFKFRTVAAESRPENIFKLFDHDWMLVTAGTMEAYNALTASWGGMGILFEKEVTMCVVRPVRHTFGFMEKSDVFTLSAFEEKYRPALRTFGRASGRDGDKAKATGMTPVQGLHGGIFFQEARLVYECRKIYYHDIDPGKFLDQKMHKFYPRKDYHRMYIGEVLTVHARFTDGDPTPPPKLRVRGVA
jgi:flavin reductase (DIM6/NTAB) family NADH-FMN oxidoreductase RutF